MLASAELRRRMAKERIAHAREAQRARLVEQARRAEQTKRRHRPSLRRTVGRSMIELGRRLAAEEHPAPVRSR